VIPGYGAHRDGERRCGRRSTVGSIGGRAAKFDLTPLSPKTGHFPALHSIISSAPARIKGGIVRPSALAVLRLITSEYFTGR
jgi:hypothetical protein